MGTLLLDTFKQEIERVKTDKMRVFYKNILELCDDLNATEPASSSGKYHPIQDLGKYGLYRHSITVAKFAEIMMRSIPKYDNAEDWDVVYVAALLHDMCKFDSKIDDGKHSLNDHPARIAKVIREYNKDNDPLFERVASATETHMSRWNDIMEYKDGNKTKVGELPLPTELENYIIVFADLMAANSDLPDFLATLEKEGVRYLVGRKN